MIRRFLRCVTLPVLVAVAGCGDNDPAQSKATNLPSSLYGTFIGRRDLDRLPLFADAGLNAVVLGHTFTSELIHEPFDQAGLDQVRQFFLSARDNGLHLVFKMTPQRGFDAAAPFPGPDDAQRDVALALITGKVDTLYAIGVRIFLLCFDDISLSSPQSGLMAAEAQAAVLRAVDARLQALDPRGTRLLVTPPYYQGSAESIAADRTAFSPRHPFNGGLAASRVFLLEYGALPARIEIFSTGPGIFSAHFSAAQVAALAALWAHPIDYWSNFPTNDVFADELVLEPFTQLEAAALPALPAVLLNRAPAYPEASHLGVLTFGEFLEDSIRYDPQAAYQRAIDRLGGSARVALRLLADQFQSHPMTRSAAKHESAELASGLAALWREHAECTTGLGAAALRDLLTRFSQVAHDLDAQLANRELYEELAPHAEKLAAIGAAGLLAVDALQASCLPEADREQLRQLAAEIESHRIALAAMRSRVTEDSVATFVQVVNSDQPTFAPTNIVDDFLRRVHSELVSE